MPAVDYPAYKDQVGRFSPTPADIEALEAARALVPELRQRRAEIESKQGLPADICERMADAGFFLMGAPTEVGGGKISYPTQFRIMEELARGDAAAGWTILVHLASAFISRFLTQEGCERLFPSPYSIHAGTPGPSGRGKKVDGGYIVRGEWNFASNSRHATKFIGGFVVVDDLDAELPAFERPRPGAAPPSGPIPDIRCAWYPASDVYVVDGSWDTLGLLGTHSGKYSADDIFVPEVMTFPLLKLPMWIEHPEMIECLDIDAPVGMGGHSMVAIGVARHALEAFYALAENKKGFFGQGEALREREYVQYQVAQAEAMVRAARAWQYEIIEDSVALWNADDRQVPESDRMMSNLNNVWVYDTCREAVAILTRLAGTDGVRRSSEIEGCFRDVQTAGAHIALQQGNYWKIGKNLLGMEQSYNPGAF